MRATGHAQLDRGDHGLHRAVDGVERAHGGADDLGHALEAQGHLGDHAQRAFGADQEPREVVAGRGLACPRAGADHRAVGQHRLQRQHVVLHRPVAHGVRARRPGRRHPADRGVRAGVDREEEALAAEALVQRDAVHAGLHDAVEVLDVDGQDPVHLRDVQRDAAVQRRDVALQRRARAEGDERDAVGGARVHDRDHVVGRAGEDHRIGGRARVPALVATVLLADRGGGHDGVAELRGQCGERGLDLVARGAGRRLDGRHGALLPWKRERRAACTSGPRSRRRRA